VSGGITPSTGKEPIMRLTPVDKPPNRFVRLFYRLLRRQFGKPLTPYQVVFARFPGAIWTQLAIYWGLGRGVTLDQGLQFLVHTHVARLNGCTFCLDIGRATAVYRGLPLEKVDALDTWRTHPAFTPAERAALAYVEETTRAKRVGDETFAELRRHFDERAIVQLTWLCAVENYFNLINLPLQIESDGLCAIAERRRAA
jgi:AhpD family alkylhydroperoxidase